MELSLPGGVLKYYNQDVFAKAAISVLHYEALKSQNKFDKLFQTKKHLISKYDSNIVVKNAIDYYLYLLGQPNHTPKEKHTTILRKLNVANQELAKNGAKKIKPGSTVFVHSLTNQVFDILKYASKYKHFSVNILDHSPLYISRELKKHLDQKIYLFPDLALKQAIKSADLCLIGADVISKKGVIAKLGSHLASVVASQYNVLFYVCAHTWMYDSKDEMTRLLTNEYTSAEQDYKATHEFFSYDLVNSIICESGILKPKHLSSEVKFYNKWMFI